VDLSRFLFFGYNIDLNVVEKLEGKDLQKVRRENERLVAEGVQDSK